MPYLNQSTNPVPSGPYASDVSNPHPPPFQHPTHSSHPSNASGPGNRGSGDFDDSRRGSVDSRIHQGIKNMDLGPTSPYNGSKNASQSSLVQGLNRERGILTNGYRGPRSSSGSGGPMSPMWPRSSEQRGFVAGRVAPPIHENPRSEVHLAEAPTRGQAWAFPDPDAGPVRPPSNFSRRNSFAESFTSSIYSDRSRLPPGQQGTSIGVHVAFVYLLLQNSRATHIITPFSIVRSRVCVMIPNHRTVRHPIVEHPS